MCIGLFRVMAQRKRYIDVKRSFRFASETNTALAKGKWGKQRESQTTGHPNQRRKISWHASHGMQRSIDRSERVFVEISCSCNSCGSHYGCCLTEHICFSLFCALKQKDYILITVYSNTEFWSLSSDQLLG